MKSILVSELSIHCSLLKKKIKARCFGKKYFFTSNWWLTLLTEPFFETLVPRVLNNRHNNIFWLCCRMIISSYSKYVLLFYFERTLLLHGEIWGRTVCHITYVIFTCSLLKMPYLPPLFPGIILSFALCPLSRCGCAEGACLMFHALELGISIGSTSRIKFHLGPA